MIKAISTALSGMLNARAQITREASVIAGQNTSNQTGQDSNKSTGTAPGSEEFLESAVSFQRADLNYKANAKVIGRVSEMHEARMRAFDTRI